MKNNVARWREKHEPFMTKNPTARQAARLQVQSHILVGESVKTISEKNFSDCVILDKTRYKNYRKFWDGCESDTASDDFAELHGVQAGEHDYSDDGGEAVEAVACKDNVGVRNSKRKKTRLGTRTETRDGDERDTTYLREASPLHHIRFEADQTRVPKDDASFTRGDGRNASPATVRRNRSSRRRNVSRHVLEGKGSRANVAPSEAGLGVKFLQMKEKMKADVEALQDRNSGPKGTQAELTAAMDQLRRTKGIFGGSVFEDMLTVIQQTLASEASEARFFDCLHRLRKICFLWGGNAVRTVLVEFNPCTRVPRYGWGFALEPEQVAGCHRQRSQENARLADEVRACQEDAT